MTPEGLVLAAQYQKHRHAMYRVAAQTLREAGLEDQAGDAVQDAILGFLNKPPKNVQNWEAFLVTAAKRRAIDILRSARVRHSGPELQERHDIADERDDITAAEEEIDRHAAAARAWDALAVLDAKHRLVAREYIGKNRPRQDVATELGVSPARVSQMATKAIALLREELK